MYVLPDDQMNYVINCLTAKSIWDDLILYHEGPSDVKESRVIDLKLCYNTFKFKEGETLTQTFTRYKTLMNELVNDGIKLSKLEINTGFINSLNNEEDIRSSHEYLNDLEEEYQARALLAKSKRFFKKGTQRFSSAKATDQTKCYKCGKKVSSDDNEMVEVKVLMALAEWKNDLISAKKGPGNSEWHVNTEILKENKNLRTELKELITITKTWFNSSNKVNQCISEQIPSQKNRILGVDQLTEDPSSSGQKDLVFVKSSADDTKVSIPGVERPWLSEAEGFILPNHDTGRILPAESQRNTIDPPIAVTDSSATDYDSTDESLICSAPLPPLKKLDGAEPVSGPKTIKSILRSKSVFKTKALKGLIINEPSSAPAKGNKSSPASKCERTDHRTCDHAEYISTINMSRHLKSLGRSSSRSKIPRPSKSFFPPCIHCGCIDHLSNKCLNYPICGLCGSYDHDTNGPNRIINLEREINLRNPQHAFKRYESCGSSTHTTTDHYDIEWFKRGEALQAKKAESLKSTRAESSNANRSKTPTKSLNNLLIVIKCTAEFIEVKPTPYATALSLGLGEYPFRGACEISTTILLTSFAISTNLDIQKNHYPLDFRNVEEMKQESRTLGYCCDHMVKVNRLSNLKSEVSNPQFVLILDYC
ncbi:hypothetical protein Tco_1229483 [Tanacetum coccineum]